MPKSPDSEGVPRLMTVSEIAQEHGVSRQTVHSYRTRGSFPKPVEGEGSTRPRFRADEVAAWFADNPPRPGKRTDLADKPPGEPVTTTVDPRTAILSGLCHPEWNAASESRGLSHDDAVKLVDAYRAAVLREAAAHLDKVHDYPSGSAEVTGAYLSGMENAARELRRLADEAEAEAQDG